MKRIGKLWSRMVSFENLHAAWRKARRGKKRSPAVAEFALRLETSLLKLQHELESGCYWPGAYRLFQIYERKPRTIAAAPFRDRVVHHALMNIIGPPLERRFIHDSYACRVGKGTHAAVARYQRWARRHAYAMKLDIRRYFPNMDHAILKGQLRRRIKDARLLDLLDRIIDGSPASGEPADWFPGDDLLAPAERDRGIPIGNLTSQFFANLYLDDFDHWVKEQLAVKCYLRYVDDMVFLADSKARLWEIAEAVERQLLGLRLRLHPGKIRVVPARCGLDLLGYRVFPWRRRLRDDNGHRFRRRLRQFARAYAAGKMQWPDFNPCVQSWIGHARQADTERLRQVIFESTVFSRGNGPPAPGCCAAAPGTANRTGCVPRTATGTPRTTGTTTGGFGSPG